MIDIVPTVLKLLELEEKAEMNGIGQILLRGKSLAYTFNNEKAKT